MDSKAIRSLFPMYENGVLMQGKPLIWLDNASTTFKPKSVIEAMERYYCQENSNAHRGDYDLSYQMDVEMEKTRKAVASFIGASEKEIVFTSGTTASLNLVAFGYVAKHLTKDDEILISESEHASNVLPWFEVAKQVGCQVKYVPLSKEGRILPSAVEAAMTEHTKIVSLAHVSNVLGYELEAKAIAEIVHRHNAIFVLDGAQSVPHLVTDVADLDCDFLAFSGHKMCGPTGIGILYGKYELLKQTEPVFTGGGMNVNFYLTGDAKYQEPPFRFEAGTQNLAGIIGLRAAIEFLSSIGMEEIERHERELKRYCVEKLEKLPKVTIYNPTSEAGIVTFNIEGVFAQDAATFFNSKGIAVRSGQHCAKLLNGFLGAPATVRASFYLYTTKEDIDAFVDAVAHSEDYLDAYFN